MLHAQAATFSQRNVEEFFLEKRLADREGLFSHCITSCGLSFHHCHAATEWLPAVPAMLLASPGQAAASPPSPSWDVSLWCSPETFRSLWPAAVAYENRGKSPNVLLQT